MVRQKEIDGVIANGSVMISNPVTKEMLDQGFGTLVLSLGGTAPLKEIALIIANLPKLRDYITDEGDRRAYDA